MQKKPRVCNGIIGPNGVAHGHSSSFPTRTFSALQAEEVKINSLEVSEGNRGGVSGADGSTDVRDSPGGAAVAVVLAVGQATEHGLAPGCADHQVRDGGRLGRQGVAESVDAAENVRQQI